MMREIVAATVLAAGTPVEAEPRPSVAPRNMQAIAPALAGYTDDVLFGDVWRRPDLLPRDRSLVTLSVLIATGRTAQMPGHLARGLDNGVKPTEVAGMVTHLAFYTGWPNAVSALNEVEKVFAQRGIDPASLKAVPPATAPLPASDAARATIVAKTVVPLAPKFAQLTNEVVFADPFSACDLHCLLFEQVVANRAVRAPLPALRPMCTRGIEDSGSRACSAT